MDHNYLALLKTDHTPLVNAGIYVIEPSLLSTVKPSTYLDMPNLLSNAQSQVYAYQFAQFTNTGLMSVDRIPSTSIY